MFDITFAEIGILIQPKYFSTVSIFHAHPISRIQTLVKVGHRVFNANIETENSSTINGESLQGFMFMRHSLTHKTRFICGLDRLV